MSSSNIVIVGTEHPMANALASWREALKGKSRSTIDCYAGDVRLIGASLAKLRGGDATSIELTDLSENDLADLATRWSNSGDAPATIQRRFVSLRRFSRHLAASGGIPGAVLHATFPKLAIPCPIIEPAVPRDTILIDEPSGWIEARDDAIVAMAADLGLSTGEMAAIDDQHFAGGLLLVSRPSGSLRMVVVPDETSSVLDRYRGLVPWPRLASNPMLLNSRGGRMSIRSIQIAIRRRREALGLPSSVVAGKFRHDRIVALANNGMPVPRIAEEMGIGPGSVFNHLRS